jgi:hypothetical protein
MSQPLPKGLQQDRQRWEIGGNLGEGSDRRPGSASMDGAGSSDRFVQRQLRSLERGYDRD